jgi:hypothetical protein
MIAGATARLHAAAPSEETVAKTSRRREVGSKMEAPEMAVLRAHLAVLEEQVAVLKATIGEEPASRKRFKADRLVPAAQMAKQLKRSSDTVIRWCKPPLRLGVDIAGTWFIDLDRLDEHLNRGQ